MPPQLQLEDLIPGQIARFTLDGQQVEGAICGFLDDGGVAMFVEGADGAEDQAVVIDGADIAQVKESAWERLCRKHPELAGEILTEELTALLPQEDAASLLEASLTLTWARAAALSRRVDQSTVAHIYGTVGKRHPQATEHEFSAFLRASRASARKPTVNIPTSGGFPTGSGGREGT